MALPPVPVPEPPIGALGAVPIAPVPDITAPGLKPEAPVPSMVAERFGVMPTVAPAPELLPLVGPAEPAPAPTPAPPRPEELTRAAEIEQAQATVEEGLGRASALDSELEDARQRFADAATPEERQKIADEAAGISDARDIVQRNVSQAQQGVQERVAQAQAGQAVEQLGAREALLREQQGEAARIRQDAEVREADRMQAVRAAEEQLKTDRQTARRLLERGPVAANFAGTMASAFAELVRASKAKEVPNLAPIFERAWQQDRQSFADEFERSQGVVRLTGDELADLAQQERNETAQKATAIAEMIMRTEAEYEIQAAQGATEQARIQASQVLPMLRQQRQQAEFEAAQAREVAELKRRETEVGIRHKEAQARKLEAEAGKLERRGRGIGAPRATPGLIAPNIVTVPDSDVPLVEFPNTSAGRKEAQATRDIVGAQANAVDTINRVLALYEDAENRGLVASAGWDRTDAYSDLEAELAMLETQMAFVRAGGGKTSQGDDEWAKGIVPASPEAWTSRKKALGDIRALRRVIENQSRNTLASKTRLDKATRESIIATSRPKAISRTRMAEREKAQAEQDLVSPKTSTDRKITAIDQIEAVSRSEASELGTEEDWLPLATAKLSEALANPEVRKDARVRDAIRDKLDRYEGFASTRRERAEAEEFVTAGQPDVAPRRKAALRQIEQATGAQERARLSRLRDTIRDMSPRERQAARLMGSGMRDLIAEVEAEE